MVCLGLSSLRLSGRVCEAEMFWKGSCCLENSRWRDLGVNVHGFQLVPPLRILLQNHVGPKGRLEDQDG